MAISGDQQMPQMQPPSLLYFLDLNTVFTISFAVFFFTAGVYFVLRSCCRSWRDSDQEVEEDGDAQRAAETKPACLTQVRAISVVLFDAGGGEAEENCPVCLEQYERGAELRVMPQCGHAFHRACVDLWLLTKSSFCPICRVRVVKRGVEPIDDWYPDYQLRRN